ncbi:MAG: peptidoglycan-associated lipoprotein Pal [Candidatus Sumerlaeaceae bacterium]|nr:peptidoglycan-associated lipoprotein Pal [Candidatus Sumerlaeaceae bacterium]
MLQRKLSLGLLKLWCAVLVVSVLNSGCRGCLGDSPLGRWFGKAVGAGRGPSSFESSVLPEPIRGKSAYAVDGLQPIYFEFDSAELLESAKEQLRRNAAWLRANRNSHIQLEGHCDERGTAEYNYALGQRRADAARMFLIQEGVEAARLHSISYGAERPADPNHNEIAWARNRRVEFKIYGE